MRVRRVVNFGIGNLSAPETLFASGIALEDGALMEPRGRNRLENEMTLNGSDKPKPLPPGCAQLPPCLDG